MGPSIAFLLIIALTEIAHLEMGQHYTQAPQFFGLVMIAIVNGFWPSIAAALVMSLYAIHAVSDLVRVIIIIITSFGIAIHIHYLRLKADKYDNVKSLMHKMKVIHSLTLSSLVNWPTWDDGDKWKMCEQVHQEVSEIMTIARGWAELEEMGKGTDES